MAKSPICDSQIFLWKVIVTVYSGYRVLQCTAKYWALLGYAWGKGVLGNESKLIEETFVKHFKCKKSKCLKTIAISNYES